MAPWWPRENSGSKNEVKHYYKVYEIETSARQQSSNYWTGSATIKPAVARIRGLQIIGDFSDRTVAEDAVFDLAKLQIDMHTK
jgi:hypothetical protein